MEVTDALLGEHGVFHLLIEQLEDALPRAQTVRELHAASEPLGISLLAHAKVEDETLFDPYERATGTLGPLKCLRHEHQQIDQRVRMLFRSEDLEKSRADVRGLLDLCRRHFAREEEVMFTAARQTFSTDVLKQLGEEWARLRGLMLKPPTE